ncbi:breast carcinoma-amplified sequence 3 [Anaeramoeba flamelloides]|uniref:Breast carcinoma-amplified sequence 3 n=1 Tax=Anaeramoeba flamelloides TaxID=1746091 RepID=A0ABQ8Y862_9EUKA|nr:breast carcinoma-amplified sequence 3 [Anaeramoeba flamelloides]
MTSGQKIEELLLNKKGILNYVSGLLPQQILTYLQRRPNLDRDTIISVNFLTYERKNVTLLYLAITYENGFEIISVNNLNDIRKVVSLKGNSFKTIRILPASSKKGKFKDQEPIIVVNSALDSKDFTKNQIKFYSLKSQKWVESLTFSSAILTIKITTSKNFQNYLAVGTSFSITLLSLNTLQKFQSFTTYPNPSFDAIFDIGTRFIAFPINKKPINETKNYQNNIKNNHSVLIKEELTKGKQVINSAKNFVSNLVHKTDQKEVPKCAGNIKIIDFRNNKIISHFKAHKHSIYHLQFNQSGSLLLTASQIGTRYHIYKITSDEDIKKSAVHLYTLKRGVTQALVSNVCFSTSSKFVIISTSHGTSHMYAICPEGGEVNSLTHLTNLYTKNKKKIIQYQRTINKIQLKSKQRLSYYSIAKLRSTKLLLKGNESNIAELSEELLTLTPMACYFIPNDGLLTIDKDGFLNLYRLFAKSGKISNNKQLLKLPKIVANVKKIVTWDVGRKTTFEKNYDIFTKHSEKLIKEKKKKKDSQIENYVIENDPNQSLVIMTENLLLQEIETVTHFNEKRPIWLGPQFRFCNYMENNKNVIIHDIKYKKIRFQFEKISNEKRKQLQKAKISKITHKIDNKVKTQKKGDLKKDHIIDIL